MELFEFKFYKSYTETFKRLPDEDAGKLIKRMYSFYFFGDDTESDSLLVETVFSQIKYTLLKSLKGKECGEKYGHLGGNPNIKLGLTHPLTSEVTTPQPHPQHKDKDKDKDKEQVKDKDKEIIISSKEDTTKSLTIKKEYGDKDINIIIDTIKRFNNGIIDGTVNENRRYGKLLKDKIGGINGFNGDYDWFLSNLIQKTDKFHISKTTSCEKIYYNLAVLIKSIQASNIPEKQKEVKSYSY